MHDKLITLKGISKVFRVGEENFTALNDINLQIESGAFMSFVGPSGSGKTTLLNLIGGLDVPTSGDLFFKHTKLSSMNRIQMAKYRRENIGFIFQTYNLLPVYSVYENVLFPLLLNGSKEKDARERVMNIVSKVDQKSSRLTNRFLRNNDTRTILFPKSE